MTDDERTDDLGTLFESITGDTSVVERQRTETGRRDVEESSEERAVDAIEHHGFADVIDGPDSVEEVA